MLHTPGAENTVGIMAAILAADTVRRGNGLSTDDCDRYADMAANLYYACGVQCEGERNAHAEMLAEEAADKGEPQAHTICRESRHGNHY